MTASPPAASTPVGTGRRERKKQRTREALIEAAFTLFAEKGFGATTVEEIADAVDVSSRTFFRYFSSKEDVALTIQEEQVAAILAALDECPHDEPIVTALRHAGVRVMRAYEGGAAGFDRDRFECLQDLMHSSPALLARSLELSQKKQSLLTEAVARRMGVDAEHDLRPHVVASAAIGVIHGLGDVAQRPSLAPRTLSEAVDQAFAVLEQGLNFPCAFAPADDADTAAS
jgi:AcrR family transcriptional regulator